MKSHPHLFKYLNAEDYISTGAVNAWKPLPEPNWVKLIHENTGIIDILFQNVFMITQISLTSCFKTCQACAINETWLINKQQPWPWPFKASKHDRGIPQDIIIIYYFRIYCHTLKFCLNVKIGTRRNYASSGPINALWPYKCQSHIQMGPQSGVGVSIGQGEHMYWDKVPSSERIFTLRWRHNEHDGISNHQPHDCLVNRLFRRRSKKTSKLRVTGLCEGNSPVTGEFPAQRASNAEIVSIWWRHHKIRATKSLHQNMHVLM